jgi:O-antigen ligase
MHRAALLALFIYAPLALLGVFNANVAAFNLVSLGLLAIPVVEGFGSHSVIGLFTGLAIGLISLGSFGGLLALSVAVSVYLFRNGLVSHKIAVCCSPLVALPVIWFSPHSVLYRLQFWRDAWGGFLSHPVFGIGPGMYWFVNGWPHAHNFFAHNLVELGIVGFVCSFGLAFAITKEIARLQTWAVVVVAAMGAWSLVDLPTFFWGSGAVLFLSLGADQ